MRTIWGDLILGAIKGLIVGDKDLFLGNLSGGDDGYWLFKERFMVYCSFGDG